MKQDLRSALKDRVLLFDGGHGTLIQSYHLTEEDFRGSLFTDLPGQMKGNNDMLALTRPDVIHDLHRRYLEAGSDVIETCTFNAQRVSQHEYHLGDQVEAINRAAARIAREEADRMTAMTPDHPRYVLGCVGPTNKMLSMSEDVNDPAARSITFDQLEANYLEQIQVLVEEGVDGILIETIFDTANAKAAISAFMKVKEALSNNAATASETDGSSATILAKATVPSGSPQVPELLLSMTVSDASGRTLSGQTIEAFVTSVMHARPLAVGLNCGLGAAGMVPYLRQMSACAPCFVTCHPNAGLPNQFGGYDDTPEDMVAQMQPFFVERLFNMIGGCCGTTPQHIAAFRTFIDQNQLPPREPAVLPQAMRLAGLEPLVAPGDLFVKVGERCNVAGSRKFLRLINEKKYDEALDIARKQIADGAMVVDVNMDDGLLDAKAEMRTFLNLLASDPSISRVPVMVDSSRFEVIEEGLKCLQGKGIVNSISLKMGEEEFLAHARTVHRLGAAVIMMNFDEQGQATDYASRVRISNRAYHLLVDVVGFDPTDIIFDPNVLTVATGMAEHNAYAADFIRATRWIHDNLPGTRVSGGLSNLSFAFRGNNYLRESMHSVFLHHAIPAGMNMAILNPATMVDYFTIPAPLALAITEVILNTYPEASERLIELASVPEALANGTDRPNGANGSNEPNEPNGANRPNEPNAPTSPAPVPSGSPLGSPLPATPRERLIAALIAGQSTTLEADLQSLLAEGQTPLEIISGPLMEGMNEVGVRFGAGKMFLPQVVKTARTMKQAVAILMGPESSSTDSTPSTAIPSTDPATPSHLHTSTSSHPSRGRIIIATVKGDVHDIGKNIVSVILACNGFEVIDLGVMVPADVIVREAQEKQADLVCLSGLITPSLEEMCHVAEAMQAAGMTQPIMVGGATTSPIHTAMRIAPLYDGPVFHVRDAASNPGLAMRLLDPATRQETIDANRTEQQRIREQQEQRQQAQTKGGSKTDTPLDRRWKCDWSTYHPTTPPFIGAQVQEPVLVGQLLPLIDWTYFYWPWRVKEESEEGRKLRADAETLLQSIANDPTYAVRCILAFYPAVGTADSIELQLRHSEHDPACPCCNRKLIVPTPRQSEGDICRALCDYVSPQGDYCGAFAATVSEAFVQRLEQLKATQGGSDYDTLLLQTLGDRLAEAAAEYHSRRLASQGWQGIRPAVGYPSLPDQKAIFLLAEMFDFASIGIRLTENGAMYPQASVSGLLISHPEARY